MIFPAIAYAQSKHINNPQKISAARKSGGGNFGGAAGTCTEKNSVFCRIFYQKQVKICRFSIIFKRLLFPHGGICGGKIQ